LDHDSLEHKNKYHSPDRTAILFLMRNHIFSRNFHHSTTEDKSNHN
uniref:Ovule protein n=1 Tax=Ascaris lumbricoides TaxID=6252 RepID=A0A0M3HL47_ASCLU